MRLIVYTGKGGVGKTSCAAATALACSRSGLRTLVVSTDPAHSLGDSLQIALGPEPLLIEGNLQALEIDALHETKKQWKSFSSWLNRYFHTGTETIESDELVLIPGLEEILALLKIRTFYKSGEYDVIIVDAAPTGETLSLLSLPDLLSWYLEKTLPNERRIARLVRPVSKPIGLVLPDEEFFDNLESFIAELDELRRILSNRETSSVRLVMNPEKMVVQEARRSYTYLSLYDFPVDAVIVNRIFPSDAGSGYFSRWAEIQAQHLASIEAGFAGLPILRAPLFETEVLGLEMLSRLGAELFRSQAPGKVLYAGRGLSIEKEENGKMLRIPLPFAEKSDITLDQKGNELFVGVGAYRRNVSLPRSLQYMKAAKAVFEDHELLVHFEQKEEVK
jgi:arsenite-transporting ATPase